MFTTTAIGFAPSASASPSTSANSSVVSSPLTTAFTLTSQPLGTLRFVRNCRLTKTFFGVPRKCVKCDKVIFMAAGYACQFCRYRCHRQCADHGADNLPVVRRVCSLSRVPHVEEDPSTGEHTQVDTAPIEQWFTWPQSPSPPAPMPPTGSLTTRSQPVTSSTAMTGSSESLHTITSEPVSPLPLVHITECPNNERQDTLKAEESIDDAATPLAPDSSTMMNRLMRLWPWSSQSREEPDVPAEPPTAAAVTSTKRVSRAADEFNAELLEHMHRHKHSCASSIGTTGSFTDSAISSGSALSSQVAGMAASMLSRRLAWVRHMVGERGAHSQDCVTPPPAMVAPDGKHRRSSPCDSHAHPTSAPFYRLSNHESGLWTTPLCSSSSWPVLDSDDVFEVSETEQTVRDMKMQQAQASTLNSATMNIPNNLQRESFRDLGEWAIDIGDLSFHECVAEGRSVKTYRGRWHGEVMIHRYTNNHLEKFLRDVHTLSKIRHENIALFMGACMEPPNLAVVTCIRRGESLHDVLHVHDRTMLYAHKMHIAKQIAQGLGYLHAKKIVLRCLSSKCVYLDGKVKICTVDYGGPVGSRDRTILSRSQLSYWAGELLRTMRIEPPTLRIEPRAYTRYSDVCLLYEMLVGTFVHNEYALQAIIYMVGSGHRPQTTTLKCHPQIRALIHDCCASDLGERPTAQHILNVLQQTQSMPKRHSSSDPDSMHKTGLLMHNTMKY